MTSLLPYFDLNLSVYIFHLHLIFFLTKPLLFYNAPINIKLSALFLIYNIQVVTCQPATYVSYQTCTVQSLKYWLYCIVLQKKYYQPIDIIETACTVSLYNIGCRVLPSIGFVCHTIAAYQPATVMFSACAILNAVFLSLLSDSVGDGIQTVIVLQTVVCCF